MKKTKTNTRRLRPAVKFTIRRIANKNPRNARVFHSFKRKLSRAAAGFLVFSLFASGMFLGEGNVLKSEIVDSNENSACVATEIATRFDDLTSRLADLSRGFPQLVENLEFCTTANCAAEIKLYETEEEIWRIEEALTELKKIEQQAREEFKLKLKISEDGIFFCENEQRCETAETTLRQILKCKKEFQITAKLFEIHENVSENYLLIDTKGENQPASVYAKKLMKTVFENRIKFANNEQAYESCVAAADVSVCQDYVQKKEEARQKETAAIQELSSLKFDLTRIIEEVNSDIVTLDIGKEDAKNLVAEEGKGWCEQELMEKKIALGKKINEAEHLKKEYETALAKLKTKRSSLKVAVGTEIEMIEVHAAAEKTAEENHTKAEIILRIWSIIRNFL